MNPGAAHFQSFSLRVEPLSPIHVGAGVTLDPNEYVLQVKDEAGWLHAIEFPTLLACVTANERAEFDDIQRRGESTWIQLRQWVQRTAIRYPRCHRFTAMVMPTAFEQLNESLRNANRSCEIEMAYRHAATGVPCIPGSSIKGSIRTAVVSHFAHANPRQAEEAAKFGCKPSANFEAVALGHAIDGRAADLCRDPFRQIAIGDAALREDSCYIDRVQILRRPGTRAFSRSSEDDSKEKTTEKILAYRDITWSRSDGESVQARAEFRLMERLAAVESPDHRGQKQLPRRFTVPDLCRMCNEFYLPRLRGELDAFPTEVEGDEPQPRDVLLSAAESLGTNQCIVRIGRHSHFECVTVGDRFAQRPAHRGKGAPAAAPPSAPGAIRFGVTRTYASGVLPLGWALLTFEPSA